MTEKKYLSTTELAKILGISRIAVFKRIKKGDIKAIKIGRNYAISVEDILNDKLDDKSIEQIKNAVNRTVEEYGEVLKKLGKKADDDN